MYNCFIADDGGIITWGGVIMPTYDTWYSDYVALYLRNRKPRTVDGYAQLHGAYISPGIGPMQLEAVTPEDVQRVLLDAGERGGQRCAQAVYALLRAVMRRAVRSRRIQWSPIDAVDRPEHTPQPGLALTAADYTAALPWILEDVGLSLALLAGLRRGEIAGLRWGDVDPAARQLHVRRQRIRTRAGLIDAPPKSASGVRDVPLCPELLAILRRSYQLAPSLRVIDTAPEAIDRRWQRLQQRELQLSQRYRLHDLRHTYVSRLLLAGAVPRVVQYVAGHASLDMTLRVYAHVTGADALRELDRIATLTR
ncbi:MAG: site-specific integrase [Clostridia bacterium]|nr:site-specific integrase [Clostridia bacterium]